ncbi:MAG: hypothetical protein RIC14_05860 [Filomicrobium sp.]
MPQLAAPEAEAARAERWVRIAQYRIDPKQPETMIDLRDRSGSFVGFQLRARRGQIGIEHFTLRFHDKTHYDSTDRFRLRRNERTKVFAREEAERFADTLSVTLDQDIRPGRYARLELWGLQTRAGRFAKRPEKLMPVPPSPRRVAASELSGDGAVLISVKEAGREVDAETLEVANKLGKFSRLRLGVRNAPLDVEKLTVKYLDGATQEFAVNGTLKAPTTSPWFEINASKFVKQVTLQMRTKTGLTSPARIELHGKLADGWLASDGEGKSFNDGWVLLGAQSAGFVGFDNDVIPLAKQDSGFEKLRVNVLGRSVTLNQLRVVYSDGEEDIIPVRSRIDDGDVFGPIELRGRDQKIREIRARYRSRIIDKVASSKDVALVQVWAKR